MRHIHTSIVSMHLAIRGNNKILRTPAPHITSSEKILPRITRRTLAQLRQANHPFSNHTYSKSTSNHIHHHNAPYVPLTYTTQFISSAASTYVPCCHPWISGHTPLEWRKSWLMDHKREDRTPPLARVEGVGRQ